MKKRIRAKNIILSVFPGMGVTSFINHRCFNHTFSVINDDNLITMYKVHNIDYKKYKYNTDKTINPVYPNNYIRCIKDICDNDDYNIIILTYQFDDATALLHAGINFTVVYPGGDKKYKDIVENHYDEISMQSDEFFKYIDKRKYTADEYFEYMMDCLKELYTESMVIKKDDKPITPGDKRRMFPFCTESNISDEINDIVDNYYYTIDEEEEEENG